MASQRVKSANTPPLVKITHKLTRTSSLPITRHILLLPLQHAMLHHQMLLNIHVIIL